jgi:hypothetical protein
MNYLFLHENPLSIYLPTYPLTHLRLPTYFSICPSVYDSTALVDLGPFFSFLIYTQSVWLLGRGISLTQGRFLYTGQHKYRINAQRHPCLEWDSNPLSQSSSGSGHCDRRILYVGLRKTVSLIAVLSVSERGRLFPILRPRIPTSKMASFALFCDNRTIPPKNRVVSPEREVISH